MSNKNSPTCNRCGRSLTDPVSIAIGLGPGCRGGNKPTSKRQRAFSARVLRGQGYVQKSTVKFIGRVYEFDTNKQGWVNNVADRVLTDEEMKSMLEQYKSVILPDDYKSCLENRKEIILSAMTKQKFTPEQTAELNQELEEIEKLIENI